MKIAVIGAGSWGTAVGSLLAKKDYDVRLWAMEKEVASGINENHKNPLYLSEIDLPDRLTADTDITKVIRNADIVVLVVVSHALRGVIKEAKESIDDDMILVSLIKGIETDTHMRMSEVVKDELGKDAESRLAVLSGPNHAEEVSREIPSATVIGSDNESVGKVLQDIFMTSYFRVYTNPDIIGVELAGATKNIVAIAAGMSDGLGFGDNSKASLMTRGLAEITRLGVSIGANPLTFSGLAGVGDLVVTCFSDLSRNRYVGEQVAKGRSLDEVTTRMNMVAEGVMTTKAVEQMRKKLGKTMPITEFVYKVLYMGKSAEECVNELMARTATEEVKEVYVPPKAK